MGVAKRVKDLTTDAGAVADTDYTILDSVSEGTRKVPMTAVRTYSQIGVSGGGGNFKVLALRDDKLAVSSGATSTTDYLTYTVNRTPADAIVPGLGYRAIINGKCTNTSGADKLLDVSFSVNGSQGVIFRLPIVQTTGSNLVAWWAEFMLTYGDTNFQWVDGHCYLGGIQTSANITNVGTIYSGELQLFFQPVGQPAMVLATTYKREAGSPSTFVVTISNSFIQQVQV